LTTYLFDTSVLITNPTAYNDFPNSDIVLPITVLDELDKLKKLPNEAGKNARVAIRKLDEISKTAADLSLGVQLTNGAFLKIDTTNHPITGDALYGDTRIIACAKALNNGELIVVSNDLNMRVRARALGMQAESYDKNAAPTDLYSGIQTIKNTKAGEDLLDNNSIKLSEYGIKLNPNECAVFVDKEGKEIAKGRKTGKDSMRMVKRYTPWGLEAKNTEQELAIDLLLDPRIPLITFVGVAGCGKSILALACGLELVLQKKVYDRLIIYRPTVDVDDGIGFFPGELESKLAPWMQPINDNLEVLMASSEGKARATLELYKEKGKIEIDALSFIRGRSIPNSFILLDEAQNCSISQIKTVLTRVGEGSCCCLTGDPSQIDNPTLDIINNGLSYVVERFKTSPLASHITFTKGERSRLATEAARLL
jgi:PhoH-like ATPase